MQNFFILTLEVECNSNIFFYNKDIESIKDDECFINSKKYKEESNKLSINLIYISMYLYI